MKKVIDSHGNELEIGKVYEFGDDGCKWTVDVLKKFDGSWLPFRTINGDWYSLIRECQSLIGTIKKAPVKLVDGKAYQFESVVTGRIWVGFYNSANDRFDESVGGNGSHFYIGDVSDFKNIIPLVPEVK